MRAPNTPEEHSHQVSARASDSEQDSVWMEVSNLKQINIQETCALQSRKIKNLSHLPQASRLSKLLSHLKRGKIQAINNPQYLNKASRTYSRQASLNRRSHYLKRRNKTIWWWLRQHIVSIKAWIPSKPARLWKWMALRKRWDAL